MWMTIDCVQNCRSLQEQRACDDTANFQCKGDGSLQWFMLNMRWTGNCCQFEHRSTRGRFLTVCVDRLLQRERMNTTPAGSSISETVVARSMSTLFRRRVQDKAKKGPSKSLRKSKGEQRDKSTSVNRGASKRCCMYRLHILASMARTFFLPQHGRLVAVGLGRQLPDWQIHGKGQERSFARSVRFSGPR